MAGFYVCKQIAGVRPRVSGVNEQSDVGGFGFAGGFVKPDGEALGVAGGLIGSDGEDAKERETLHGRGRRKAAFGSATEGEGKNGNEPEAHGGTPSG